MTKDPHENPSTKLFDTIRPWLFSLLALTAIVIVLAHIQDKVKIDNIDLFFLATAGALLVFERIIKFSVTKDGVTAEMLTGIKNDISNVKQDVSDAKQVARENQLALTGGVGGKVPRATESKAFKLRGSSQELELRDEGEEDPDDTQKGRFGGQPVNNGRELAAVVVPAEGSPNNFKVSLTVSATRDSKEPLTGDVAFFLHETFRKKVRYVSVVGDVARLDLLAYGAFTVGAIADGGETKLELDLSQDPSFPKKFRES